MSVSTLRSVWHQLPRFKNWSVAPRTFVASADERHKAFLICNPDATVCALVVDDVARVQMPLVTLQVSAEDEIESPQSFVEDEARTAHSEPDLDNPTNSIDSDAGEQDEFDDDDDLPDAEGIDLEEFEIFLSPNGSLAIFTFYQEGKPHICRVTKDGVESPMPGAVDFVLFSDDGERYLLGGREHDNRMFTYDGVRTHSGQGYCSAFSPNGKHLISFVLLSDTGPISLFLNGVLLAQYATVLSWADQDNPVPSTDVRQSLILDPESNYALFCARPYTESEAPHDHLPTVFLIDLDSGTLSHWPGIRVLAARWKHEDFRFELTILSSLDEFRVPLRMRIPYPGPGEESANGSSH